MGKTNWKDDLATFFDDLSVIKKCKEEAVEKFIQFCEFIADPAFETLNEEFRQYGIKCKLLKSKGKSIAFKLNFPRSRIDNFTYIISLPKNSIELKLRLQINGRKDKKSLNEEREEPFMENVEPSEVLKLAQEDLIRDFIEHYKNFTYNALPRPE